MLKLRNILLCDYLYYLLLVLIFLLSAIRIMIPKESSYSTTSTKVIGVITNYSINGNKLKLALNAKEKLIINYYFKKENDKNAFIKNYHYGDKIEVSGEFKEPSSATSFYLFDYKNYLYNKHIFYLVDASKIIKKESNKNLYYCFKDKIGRWLGDDPYLNTFILGNKDYLTTEAMSSYQTNGISHLFAISGMHISLLSSIILKVLNKFKFSENKRYFTTTIFLIIYSSITQLTPSIIRGVLFFILFSVNKIYYFYIKPVNLYILSLMICLTIDPFYLYDVGFWYSFSISFALIIAGSYINSNSNYLVKLLKTSIISFFVSIPISLYNFYQLNFMGIIYNLIYVPFVSIIIFPLSLLTFLIPILLPIYHIFIMILEKSSIILAGVNIFQFTLPRLHFAFYVIYYLVIIMFLKSMILDKVSFKKMFPLIFLCLIHYLSPYIKSENYINFIDVGQGDSIFMHYSNKNILIDTGGSISYDVSSWAESSKSYSLVNNLTISLLKSGGIRKIHYLILTHGDYDHMGEAINLVNNFKVEKVIFNCGPFNDLESELIKVLDKKKIKYHSCIKELNIDNNKLYFLNNGDYGNENDNSSVIYTKLNNHKFLFMGDAGVEVEEDLIEKYNLQNIDVLKVGHHGSKTSSSKTFVDEINPKYSIISVGKNNRYGHPNKEVLNNLEDSKRYRTDQDGSIIFKIRNNKLKIETCSP